MSGCFGGSDAVEDPESKTGVSYDDVFGTRPASAVERKKLYKKPSEETVRDYNRRVSSSGMCDAACSSHNQRTPRVHLAAAAAAAAAAASSNAAGVAASRHCGYL